LMVGAAGEPLGPAACGRVVGGADIARRAGGAGAGDIEVDVFAVGGVAVEEQDVHALVMPAGDAGLPAAVGAAEVADVGAVVWAVGRGMPVLKAGVGGPEFFAGFAELFEFVRAVPRGDVCAG